MNVYEVITNTIVSQLEKGVVPWQRPWNGGEAPKNLNTGKNYRGINAFLLGSTGYSSPYWLTFKQIKDRGGYVKKGEHSMPVVFWKFDIIENKDTGEKEKKALLRYYRVFNVEQTEKIDYPKPNRMKTFNAIPKAESVVANMPGKPLIQHERAQAYYVPALDIINMPKHELFNRPGEYYSTLFHEMTHATGHKSRLDRPTLTDLCPFGSTNYSKEELVAEMGAAFLCGHVGIENRTIDNSAAYIGAWLRKLKNEKSLVILAAAQAQKAVDYILNVKHENGVQTQTA